MKSIITALMLIPCFLFFGKTSFAQSQRSYTASRFSLSLDGSPRALLKPVEKGDTLVYTVNRLADSILIRKKFDSIPAAGGKKYFLKYQLMKKSKTGKPVAKSK
jgi:hypothetical protein